MGHDMVGGTARLGTLVAALAAAVVLASCSEVVRATDAGQDPTEADASAEDGPADAGESGDAADAAASAFDAMSTPADAAPDAMPVECENDDACQTPPDACLRPGSCNLVTNTCVYPPVDCSGLDSECAEGACNPDDGSCIAMPINEDAACGAETVCGNFGSCQGTGCDLTGVKSRTCNDFTCQAGTCTEGPSYTDDDTCPRDTEGDSCGSTQISGCGMCQYDGPCDESSFRTCTCTDFTCSSGQCTSSDRSCTTSCTRNTDGEVCGVQPCGNVQVEPLCCSAQQCKQVCGECS